MLRLLPVLLLFCAFASAGEGGRVSARTQRIAVTGTDGKKLEGVLLFRGARGLVLVAEGRERFVPEAGIAKVEPLPEAPADPATAGLIVTYSVGVEAGSYLIGAAPPPANEDGTAPKQKESKPGADAGASPPPPFGLSAPPPAAAAVAPASGIGTLNEVGGASTNSYRTGNTLRPAITSPLAVNALLSAPFTYSIAGTNNPTQYNAVGLPPGLTVNRTTGVISGVPTVTGVTAVTISATNSSGTGSAVLTLTVTETLAAPHITSPLTVTASVGASFEYRIEATNGPTSFGASGVPPGLTFDSRSGRLAGTPTAEGVFLITLSAANAGGTDTATLKLTVTMAKPVITSAPRARAPQGQAFLYQIAATGSPTSYGATPLPAWLSFDSASGRLTGTPPDPGPLDLLETTITLSATNASGTGTATLKVEVTQFSLLIQQVETGSVALPADDQEVLFDSPIVFQVVPHATGLASFVWTAHADDEQWNLIGATTSDAGTFTIKHSPAPNPVATSAATFSKDTWIQADYLEADGTPRTRRIWISLMPQMAVSLTEAHHPLLTAYGLQAQFDADGTLLRGDADGVRYLRDSGSVGARTAMMGRFDKDDVPLRIEFSLTGGGGFPDQSTNLGVDATEQFNYTLPLYNEAIDDTTSDQLLAGSFSHIKQIKSGRIGFVPYSGLALKPGASMIITGALGPGTCAHEWGHNCGLEHRSETTSIVTPFDPSDAAAPYLLSYGNARREINRYERLQMLLWTGALSGGISTADLRPIAAAACLVENPRAGADVMLSASASLGGDSLFCLWEQVSGPPVRLEDAQTPWPAFRPDEAGVYVFRLTVTDAAGRASEPTEIRVEVAP